VKFRIHERVEWEVDAPSAQEALDQFLSDGADAHTFIAVHERHVTDEQGNEQEVEDQ
jgi:hypothetical protein